MGSNQHFPGVMLRGQGAGVGGDEANSLDSAGSIVHTRIRLPITQCKVGDIPWHMVLDPTPTKEFLFMDR